MSTGKPVKTGFTRVFLVEGRARPDHDPRYMSTLKMTGVSQGFGDVTKIEVPDPNEYGKFIEVDRVRGSVERATTSLVGHYASTIKSTLLKLAKSGCPSDVQLHIGECYKPNKFDAFTKAIILEDVLVTNWSTEDLGALGSDEQSSSDETAEISAIAIYEVSPLSFSEKAGDMVTNEVIDVITADAASCGDCGTESDGCFKSFALTVAAGGSPTTPADVVYTVDKGANWYAHDIDTMATAEEPNALALVDDYIVVVSNETNSAHYALQSEFAVTGDPVFAEVATGFVVTGEPNDIWSLGPVAFIVGDGGYVYYMTDVTEGVTVLESGSLTPDNFNAVHAFDEYSVVAVGNSGAVIATTDRINWSVKTRPTGAGVHLTSVWMKSASVWIVTAADGTMYYTIDSGVTWTAKTLAGVAPSSLDDVAFSTDSVGYAVGTVGSNGAIWRTFDGGRMWIRMPEGTGQIVPLSDTYTAVAACSDDPDFVLAVGLGDNAVDGIIVLGTAQAA